MVGQYTVTVLQLGVLKGVVHKMLQLWSYVSETEVPRGEGG